MRLILVSDGEAFVKGLRTLQFTDGRHCILSKRYIFDAFRHVRDIPVERLTVIARRRETGDEMRRPR